MVESRYLSEMAELDHVELAATYLSLRRMELALIGAGVGDGIKHTSKVNVITTRKPCKASMQRNVTGKSEIRNDKAQFD